MKNIYELVEITRNHRKIIRALVPKSNTSPLKKLMLLTFEHATKTDHECMIDIYGRSNKPAFSSLKKKYSDILYKAVLFQNDLSEHNDKLSNTHIELLRQMLISRILLTSNHYQNRIKFCEKSILNSINKGFSEHVIFQSLALIRKDFSLNPNFDRFNKYTNIHNHYLDVYYWESKAELFYYELKKYQLTSVSSVSNTVKEKSLKYITELSQAANISTPKFLYNKYRVYELHYEFLKDFKSIIITSESIINELLKYENASIIYLNNIYVRKIYALIQNNQIDDAIDFGEKILLNTLSNSGNWSRVYYYIIKSYFYIRKYTEGVNLFYLLFLSEFKKINKSIVLFELINILHGYSLLLLRSNLIDPNKLNFNELPEFKIGKFLNETPIFSKDKRGINVSILLLHIAFLLIRKDYNAIIDRTDALNQYAYRYLRKDDSFRSNCMIKMVIQMTKAGFHPVRTERYTADLLKQLKAVPLAGSGGNIEIEFIPFEVLWEIMIGSLSKP